MELGNNYQNYDVKTYESFVLLMILVGISVA